VCVCVCVCVCVWVCVCEVSNEDTESSPRQIEFPKKKKGKLKKLADMHEDTESS
jgi:hypothetical protein